MATKDKYHYGLGRRKRSTARARLYGGKGNITINDKPANVYLDDDARLLHELIQPLSLIGKEKAFDITIRVSGGGTSGQVGAMTLAIANALAVMNDDLRTTLKKAGLLKRDPREKERKKYGLRKARKKEQFSKR